MGAARGSSFDVQVVGLDACLRVLTRAGAELHNLDASSVRLSNSTLRAEAKQLADDFGRNEVAPLVAAHGGPQGPKMADTIRPKADRLPIVRIGAVNPKLSGFKTRRKETSRRSIEPARWKGSLAWGVEKGPYPGAPGRYGRGRADGGYIIGPRLDALVKSLAPRYTPMLAAALESAGWPVASRDAA